MSAPPKVVRNSPKPTRLGGRAKGTPNKVTADARAAIATFIDGNAHRLQAWLDEIAIDNPEKAFVLFQSLVEYHVPKLARREIVGDPNAPIALVLNGSDVHG